MKEKFDDLNSPKRYCRDCKHYLKEKERCQKREEHVGRKNYCNFWEK